MLRGRFSVTSRLFLIPDLEWCCVELLVQFTVRAGEMLASLDSLPVRCWIYLWIWGEDRRCVHARACLRLIAPRMEATCVQWPARRRTARRSRRRAVASHFVRVLAVRNVRTILNTFTIRPALATLSSLAPLAYSGCEWQREDLAHVCAARFHPAIELYRRRSVHHHRFAIVRLNKGVVTHCCTRKHSRYRSSLL